MLINNNFLFFVNFNISILRINKKELNMLKTKHSKLFSFAVAVLFTLSQSAYADGLADASINSTLGGFVGMTTGTNSATLKFDDNTHVIWDTLNVNANETLNFKAVNGASGLTVLNTVSGGQMSHIYGQVNSNEGISNLIISNPSGLLFDGAHFTTAGDVMLTTQGLESVWDIYWDPNEPVPEESFVFGGIDSNGIPATGAITIKNSTFNIGGETFKIVGPRISMSNTEVNTQRLQLYTRNGEEYLVNNYNNMVSKPGVTMKSVSVNGNVLIVSGEDYVKIVNGSLIDGDLGIYSQGDVNLNDSRAVNNHNNPMLEVAGSINIENTGNFANGSNVKLKNVNTKEDLSIRNDHGNVILHNVEVSDRYNEGSTISAGNGYNSNSENVILQGTNVVRGSLDINASNNVIVGDNTPNYVPGSLNVYDGLYVKTFNGSALFKDNTTANVISIDSAKNILTAAGDGAQNGETAMLKANYYGFFTNNGYTGAVEDSNALNLAMQDGTVPTMARGYMNIAGGTLMGHGFNNSELRIKSHDDLTVSQYNTNGKMYLTAVSNTDPLGSDITINSGVQANEIIIGGETKNLTVPLNSRNYDLKFTNIRDTAVTEIAGNQAITYEDFNAAGGYNDGEQTSSNTKVTAPTEPERLHTAYLTKKDTPVTSLFVTKKRK